MKYYIYKPEDTIWLRRENNKVCECPFADNNWCGDWCPLFDLRECDRIPQVDAPDKVRLEVRLHCGAGTRVIEVEASEKEVRLG